MLAQMVEPLYIAQTASEPMNSTPAASGTKIGVLHQRIELNPFIHYSPVLQISRRKREGFVSVAGKASSSTVKPI